MKFLSAALLVILSTNFVLADAFYQNNNPFPTQVCPQNLNNIYETTQAAMGQERQTEKKIKKSKWWQVKNDTFQEETKNEGIQYPSNTRIEESGFIIVK